MYFQNFNIMKRLIRSEKLRWEKFLLDLKKISTDFNEDYVKRAYLLTSEAHREQCRDEGTPFIEHPERVTLKLAQALQEKNNSYWKNCPYTTSELYAIALTHDVLEDTSIGHNILSKELGDKVSEAVKALSKPPKKDFASYEERTNFYLTQLINNYHISLFILKLCDRLDNLQAVHRSRREKAERYLRETRNIYIPLAQKYALGFAEKLEEERGKLSLFLSYPSPTGE